MEAMVKTHSLGQVKALTIFLEATMVEAVVAQVVLGQAHQVMVV
jgi:hypothetical protein